MQYIYIINNDGSYIKCELLSRFKKYVKANFIDFDFINEVKQDLELVALKNKYRTAAHLNKKIYNINLQARRALKKLGKPESNNKLLKTSTLL
jgi:hypothetical protein